MMSLYEVALYLGAKENEEGAMSMAEFDRLGLPMFGGCYVCEASLAAFNMYPTQNGFVACESCVPDGKGFETGAEFVLATEEEL